VATELRRDVSQHLDDYFEIVIDSAHDRRNAYVFQITPLGTQRDALITEEHQGSGDDDGDSGWDGIWTSEARIGEQGWTATIAIPFSTLNFMKSNDVIWGINFKRFIRRKNEEDLWSGWQRVNGIARISEAGELHGISDIGSGRLFVIKPYGLLGIQHLPESVASTGLTPGWSCLCSGGVDAKVGLRSNLVVNATVNTDFADTDVDLQQAVGHIVALRAVMGNPLTLQSDIDAVLNDQLEIGNELIAGEEYATFCSGEGAAKDLSAAAVF
jgi:hypothetical protein